MSMESWLQRHESDLVAGKVPPASAYMETPGKIANKISEAVNHPDHYQGDGIECIDAIRAALGTDGFIAYCRGNAIKYAWRAGKKGPNAAEDMGKAAVYSKWAAEAAL